MRIILKYSLSCESTNSTPFKKGTQRFQKNQLVKCTHQKENAHKRHKNLRRYVWITFFLVCLRYWTESDFEKKTFMRYMVGLDRLKCPKFSGQRWWVFCSSRKWLDLLGKQVPGFQVYFSMRRFQEFQQKRTPSSDQKIQRSSSR